jgi:hypothetical protein
MQRMLRIVLVAAVVLGGATAAAAYFVLHDTDRLKPALEFLIEDRTGVPLRIGGDIAWRLWPPVSLQAADLRADHQGQAWHVGALSLDLDLRSVLADPRQWRVQSLTVNDVRVLEDGNRLTIDQATVADLEARRAAPFSARLAYLPAAGEEIPLSLDGVLQIDPDTLELALQQTRIETPDASGVCDAEVRALAEAPAAPPATAGDLIPIAVFRAYQWAGQCRFDHLVLNEHRFEAVTIELSNAEASGTNRIYAPEFFGGDARFELHIEAGSEPVRWHVTPTLTGVDSQALLDWFDQPLRWAAPLIFSGELHFEGNDRTALLRSLSGRSRFDGGQGVIDIAEIRARLLELAAMLDERERIARWPEVWAYQRLTGDWRVDQQSHVMDLTLDNLQLRAEGDYDADADHLDMAVELVFGQDPALPVFELNPLLYDLPIPLRCRGAIAEPDCRLDGDAARRIVARALAGGENNAMRATLEQKIDEQVPEQYRDAARALLEMLSGGDRGAPQDE